MVGEGRGHGCSVGFGVVGGWAVRPAYCFLALGVSLSLLLVLFVGLTCAATATDSNDIEGAGGSFVNTLCEGVTDVIVLFCAVSAEKQVNGCGQRGRFFEGAGTKNGCRRTRVLCCFHFVSRQELAP